MLKTDYKKLYRLQDNFLDFWKTLDFPFYLTGGTALGRFYLNHRYSEDLDFFVNQNENYNEYIEIFSKKINTFFNVENKKTLKYDVFSRFFINDNNTLLKIEFVNDVAYRTGEPNNIYFGKIDTPFNILSNKISTIINREEPKDMFDIIHIALNYKFNWKDVFFETKEKNIINEIDVEQRINSFPVELFEKVTWMVKKSNNEFCQKCLRIIADDFLTGSDNSLSKTNIKIKDAKPIL